MSPLTFHFRHADEELCEAKGLAACSFPKAQPELQGKPQITPMVGNCCGQAQCRGGRSQLPASLSRVHSFLHSHHENRVWGGSQSPTSRRLLLLSPTKNHGTYWIQWLLTTKKEDITEGKESIEGPSKSGRGQIWNRYDQDTLQSWA